MIHLRQILYSQPASVHSFPFSLPILQTLTSVNFSQVTIFVGENGTGKSTLLEALAAKLNLQTFGEQPISQDPTLQTARILAKYLKLIWNRPNHHGFFLRSEDFFAYIKQIEHERGINKGELQRIEQEFHNHSNMAKIKAASPYKSALAQIHEQFGENADGQSHGEGYLSLFRHRLYRKGIFLIDEAEAALSPISQLALVHMIQETVKIGGQFILATHSPILLGIPNAKIYSCDSIPIEVKEYDHLPHVEFYRDFLDHPQAFFKNFE